MLNSKFLLFISYFNLDKISTSDHGLYVLHKVFIIDSITIIRFLKYSKYEMFKITDF